MATSGLKLKVFSPMCRQG